MSAAELSDKIRECVRAFGSDWSCVIVLFPADASRGPITIGRNCGAERALSLLEQVVEGYDNAEDIEVEH